MDNDQVNCLYYYYRDVKSETEKIPYCLGPEEKPSFDDVDFRHVNRRLTFDQLRGMNITSYELHLWSSTIDLAEKYQDYLDHPHQSIFSKEIFLNCTKAYGLELNVNILLT